MAVKTVNLTYLEAYSVAMNYDQALLHQLFNGNLSNIPALTYNCDESQSINLNDISVTLTVEDARQRFGEQVTEFFPQSMTAGVDERLLDEWTDELEEIVLYIRGETSVNCTIREMNEYGEEYGDDLSWDSYYNDCDICVMAKTTDGRILDTYNWGNPSALYNNLDSTYKKRDGSPVWGIVYELDQGYAAFNWSVSKNNFLVSAPYFQCGQTSSVRMSHKCFKDNASARRYLLFGDDSGEIGGGEGEPAEDRLTTLYYQDTVIRRGQRSAVKEEWFKHSIKFEIQYKKNDGTLITPPRMSIVGYVTDLNQSTFSNINWMYADGVKVKESKWSYGEISGSQHHGENPPDTIPEVMCFYGNTTIAPYEFESKYYTNMKIFANEEDARAFLNGDKTRIPLYDGANGKIKGDGVGDPIIYNTQAEGGAHSSMSECWLMTQSQLDNLASIFTSNLTLAESQSSDVFYKSWTSFVRGLDMYNNPIDMVCDLFWLPINISEYAIFSDRTEWTVSGEENGSAGSGVWADPFASGQNKLFNLHPNYGQGTLYESLKAEADAKVEQLNDYAQQGGIPVVNRRTGEAETIPLIIQGGAQ